MQIMPIPLQPNGTPKEALRRLATEIETTFLSEMLKHAGIGKTPMAFGGGSAETQFSSFLRDEQARQIAAVGGLGLAESIFRNVADRIDG